MVIFHIYVKLPEGIYIYIYICICVCELRNLRYHLDITYTNYTNMYGYRLVYIIYMYVIIYTSALIFPRTQQITRVAM